MVFVQAVANPEGPSFACFELARSGQLTLCVSPEVLAEVSEVLSRPKLRRKLPNLTPEVARVFLADVTGYAELTGEVPEPFHYERDPKDEKYVNLALAVGARYLVSRDKDLLALMADKGFQDSYPGLTILDPSALLRELAQKPEEPADRGEEL